MNSSTLLNATEASNDYDNDYDYYFDYDLPSRPDSRLPAFTRDLLAQNLAVMGQAVRISNRRFAEKKCQVVYLQNPDWAAWNVDVSFVDGLATQCPPGQEPRAAFAFVDGYNEPAAVTATLSMAKAPWVSIVVEDDDASHSSPPPGTTFPPPAASGTTPSSQPPPAGSAPRPSRRSLRRQLLEASRSAGRRLMGTSLIDNVGGINLQNGRASFNSRFDNIQGQALAALTGSVNMVPGPDGPLSVPVLLSGRSQSLVGRRATYGEGFMLQLSKQGGDPLAKAQVMSDAANIYWAPEEVCQSVLSGRQPSATVTGNAQQASCFATQTVLFIYNPCVIDSRSIDGIVANATRPPAPAPSPPRPPRPNGEPAPPPQAADFDDPGAVGWDGGKGNVATRTRNMMVSVLDTAGDAANLSSLLGYVEVFVTYSPYDNCVRAGVDALSDVSVQIMIFSALVFGWILVFLLLPSIYRLFLEFPFRLLVHGIRKMQGKDDKLKPMRPGLHSHRHTKWRINRHVRVVLDPILRLRKYLLYAVITVHSADGQSRWLQVCVISNVALCIAVAVYSPSIHPPLEHFIPPLALHISRGADGLSALQYFFDVVAFSTFMGTLGYLSMLANYNTPVNRYYRTQCVLSAFFMILQDLMILIQVVNLLARWDNLVPNWPYLPMVIFQMVNLFFANLLQVVIFSKRHDQRNRAMFDAYLAGRLREKQEAQAAEALEAAAAAVSTAPHNGNGGESDSSSRSSSDSSHGRGVLDESEVRPEAPNGGLETWGHAAPGATPGAVDGAIDFKRHRRRAAKQHLQEQQLQHLQQQKEGLQQKQVQLEEKEEVIEGPQQGQGQGQRRRLQHESLEGTVLLSAPAARQERRRRGETTSRAVVAATAADGDDDDGEDHSGRLDSEAEWEALESTMERTDSRTPITAHTPPSDEPASGSAGRQGVSRFRVGGGRRQSAAAAGAERPLSDGAVPAAAEPQPPHRRGTASVRSPVGAAGRPRRRLLADSDGDGGDGGRRGPGPVGEGREGESSTGSSSGDGGSPDGGGADAGGALLRRRHVPCETIAPVKGGREGRKSGARRLLSGSARRSGSGEKAAATASPPSPPPAPPQAVELTGAAAHRDGSGGGRRLYGGEDGEATAQGAPYHKRSYPPSSRMYSVGGEDATIDAHAVGLPGKALESSIKGPRTLRRKAATSGAAEPSTSTSVGGTAAACLNPVSGLPHSRSSRNQGVRNPAFFYNGTDSDADSVLGSGAPLRNLRHSVDCGGTGGGGAAGGKPGAVKGEDPGFWKGILFAPVKWGKSGWNSLRESPDFRYPAWLLAALLVSGYMVIFHYGRALSWSHTVSECLMDPGVCFSNTLGKYFKFVTTVLSRSNQMQFRTYMTELADSQPRILSSIRSALKINSNGTADVDLLNTTFIMEKVDGFWASQNTSLESIIANVIEARLLQMGIDANITDQMANDMAPEIAAEMRSRFNQTMANTSVEMGENLASGRLRAYSMINSTMNSAFSMINATTKYLTRGLEVQKEVAIFQEGLSTRFKYTSVLGFTLGLMLGLWTLVQTAISFRRAVRQSTRMRVARRIFKRLFCAGGDAGGMPSAELLVGGEESLLATRAHQTSISLVVFFFGVLMSTAVIQLYMVGVLFSVVLAFITHPWTYNYLMPKIWLYLVAIVAVFILNKFVLIGYVGNAFLSNGDHIYRPAAWLAFTFIMSITNLVIGLLLAVYRIVLLLLTTVLALGKLEVTIFTYFSSLDLPHNSFLAGLHMHESMSKFHDPIYLPGPRGAAHRRWRKLRATIRKMTPEDLRLLATLGRPKKVQEMLDHVVVDMQAASALASRSRPIDSVISKPSSSQSKAASRMRFSVRKPSRLATASLAIDDDKSATAVPAHGGGSLRHGSAAAAQAAKGAVAAAVAKMAGVVGGGGRYREEEGVQQGTGADRGTARSSGRGNGPGQKSSQEEGARARSGILRAGSRAATASPQKPVSWERDQDEGAIEQPAQEQYPGRGRQVPVAHARGGARREESSEEEAGYGGRAAGSESTDGERVRRGPSVRRGAR